VSSSAEPYRQTAQYLPRTAPDLLRMVMLANHFPLLQLRRFAHVPDGADSAARNADLA